MPSGHSDVRGELDRRQFLQAGIGLAAAATASAQPQIAKTPAASGIIDTHVYLDHWPFRRVPHDEPAALVEHLNRHGVIEAWAGSFDALLHKDIGAVNQRLADTCRNHPMLIPIGSINPTLPDWEDELARCHEQHGMRAIRLHPNYHRYSLGDESFARLLRAAGERRMLVQLSVLMEDDRTHHPMMVVPDTDIRPLAAKLKTVPELRVQLLNGFRVATVPALAGLADNPKVHFEFAWLDTIRGVAELIERVGIERVSFGSYAPMLYFESALLKMRESMLSPETMQAICTANPRRLMGPRTT